MVRPVILYYDGCLTTAAFKQERNTLITLAISDQGPLRLFFFFFFTFIDPLTHVLSVQR